MLFITSLAGIGYVAPEELARTVEFSPGTPVFDLAGRQAMERRMQEQKALENEWAKKKRPKDVSIVLVSLCRLVIPSRRPLPKSALWIPYNNLFLDHHQRHLASLLPSVNWTVARRNMSEVESSC